MIHTAGTQEETMAQDNTPKMPAFEVPAEMRDFAEKSVEQARKAFETFIGAAHRTIESADGSSFAMGNNMQDMTKRALNLAEQNMRASFDHAQRLVRAKDMQEAMQLQSEFWQKQLAFMQQNVSEMGANVTKAATEAAKRKG
jgi:phasin